MFIGLLRIAPGGRTFQAPRLLSIGGPPIHRCRPRSSLRSCDRMQHDAITGPGDARLARRDGAAWTAGSGNSAPHLRRPRTGHRSPPRVWRLQTPRYSGRDGWDYSPGLKARQWQYMKKILSPFSVIYPRASHVMAGHDGCAPRTPVARVERQRNPGTAVPDYTSLRPGHRLQSAPALNDPLTATIKG